jgi:hypothetical protein
MKSIYQLEKEKWDTLMSFEERAIEEEGKFKSENAKTPVEREMIESFMNREYKTMVELEKKLLAEMRDIIKVYGRLSLVSPCTFLSWAQGEMSSRGFASLVEFYEYAQDLKDKFCRFYKDRKFFSGKGENGVESFIKGDENVFYGSKRLPFNILWGVIGLLVLIFVLRAVSYFSHKKALSRVYGEMAAQWNPGSFNPAGSKYFVWQIEEDGFSERMYNHLRSGYNFLYLCHPGLLPGDVCVGDFLELAAALLGVSPPAAVPDREKRFGELKDREKFQVLMTVTELAQQSGKSHYLFHDLTRDMPVGASVTIKKRMEALKSQGAAVMLFLWKQVVDDSEQGQSYGIREAVTWSEQVENWEKNIE